MYGSSPTPSFIEVFCIDPTAELNTTRRRRDEVWCPFSAPTNKQYKKFQSPTENDDDESDDSILKDSRSI
jgi:hypothetical protein